MLRKLVFVVIVGALGSLGFGIAAPANAAGNGTACQLSGAATFVPGLGATPGQYTYTFNGNVTDCRSNVAGGPTGGTVTASGNGPQSGGCAFSLGGVGSATVNWGGSPSDISKISYTTQGIGAGVLLSGQVTSGRYLGNRVSGVLAFQTSSPQDCAAGGLTSATFTGETALND
jgi:hypothetical protein